MKPVSNKKYLKLYEETAKNKVLEVLFKYPEKEFSLSDLAKEASVAKANIGKILLDFKEMEIITVEELSKIWRIKANQQSWVYIRNKIVYNLNLIYSSGLVDFLIDHFKNPKAIILFGSFRKGEDQSNSDIDIAIESEEIDGYKTVALRELSDFEQRVGKKVQIHLFNKETIDLGLFNNISNGILLWGFLEVKP